jgi:hypothetical protein
MSLELILPVIFSVFMCLYPYRSGCYYCHRTCNVFCKVLRLASNFDNRLAIHSYWRQICLPCMWNFGRPTNPDIFGNQCPFWYMNELTCDCIHYCYCSETKGDLDNDYPNPTIHCHCELPLDWNEIPTCNCDIQQCDTFFDCVEEADCILCALWHLDLHSLLSQYLFLRV